MHPAVKTGLQPQRLKLRRHRVEKVSADSGRLEFIEVVAVCEIGFGHLENKNIMACVLPGAGVAS